MYQNGFKIVIMYWLHVHLYRNPRETTKKALKFKNVNLVDNLTKLPDRNIKPCYSIINVEMQHNKEIQEKNFQRKQVS